MIEADQAWKLVRWAVSRLHTLLLLARLYRMRPRLSPPNSAERGEARQAGVPIHLHSLPPCSVEKASSPFAAGKWITRTANET